MIKSFLFPTEVMTGWMAFLWGFFIPTTTIGVFFACTGKKRFIIRCLIVLGFSIVGVIFYLIYPWVTEGGL